jgi:hypothetical protein
MSMQTQISSKNRGWLGIRYICGEVPEGRVFGSCVVESERKIHVRRAGSAVLGWCIRFEGGECCGGGRSVRGYNGELLEGISKWS